MISSSFMKSEKQANTNLSLDEYIKQSGLYISPMIKKNAKSNQTNGEEEISFKTKGRKKYSNDDDDEDDVLMLNEDDEEQQVLDNGSDNFDLRSKISGNANSGQENRQLKASSAQWRLVDPNRAPNRPSGMPPLVPTNGDNPMNGYTLNNRPKNSREFIQNNYNQTGCEGNNGRWKKRNNWNNNNNRNNNNNNRNNNYNRNGYNNNNNYNRNNGNGNYNNNNNMRNQSAPYVVPQNNRRNALLRYNNVGACDIMIEASPNAFDVSSTQVFPHESILTPKQPPIVLDPTPTMSLTSPESFKEIMPMMASKFLEMFQANAVHKPKYDMQMQKEIHQIQNKPMLYKCPGGEVVSSDGKGINNLSVPVRSTGISLNNRFA